MYTAIRLWELRSDLNFVVEKEVVEKESHEAV